MKNFFCAFGVVAFFFAPFSLGQDTSQTRVFYVDSQSGNDANTGNSPALAWASLKRVNEADLLPGDSVRFKRSGIWRGSLVPASGQAGRPVTYTAYGEGEKPLLLGSVSRSSPTDWVAAGGNIWATKKRRLEIDVGNIIFGDEQQCGWKRWSLEELQRPYDYFYDRENMRIFVYLERNPAEVHDRIELALRRHIVDQGGRHDVIYDGFDLRYGAAHGFGGGSTARLIIRNCDLSYIGGGHQHTREDGKPVRYGNAIEFWGSCRDNLVENCRISEVYDAALTNQGRSPDSVQENITYRNNLIRNCEYSFEYWNNPETARTRNIRFENNTCVDAGVVWSHAQRPDPNGSHLMFYTNLADTEKIVVRYNIFYRSTEWGSRYSAGWKPLPDMDYNVWHVPTGKLCYFFREHIPGNDVKGYRDKTGLDRHSFFGDPKFVDPENGDYRLSPDSLVRSLRPDGGLVGRP